MRWWGLLSAHEIMRTADKPAAEKLHATLSSLRRLFAEKGDRERLNTGPPDAGLLVFGQQKLSTPCALSDAVRLRELKAPSLTHFTWPANFCPVQISCPAERL